MEESRFHLAFPVHDLKLAKLFYQDLLGCEVGRCSNNWIDFNFKGHQITAHLKPDECDINKYNSVDGDNVPVRHFGLILEWKEWHKFSALLIKKRANFIIKPKVRFKGKKGEQATFFILDPSRNALEFKAFKSIKNIFLS